MRNGLVWNRCCPTRSRVVVGGGPITARCSTGCSGGPVVVSRGGMCRLRSEAGRPSRTGIAAGQVTAPWLGSWTPCAAAPTWPKARTGRSGWTARWSAPINTPPVPATPRPPTSLRRSSRRPSWTQGGGSNDKKSGDEPDPPDGQSTGRPGKPSREAIGRSRGGLTSKIHLAADRRCRPISRVTSAGQRHDSLGFRPVMAGIRIRRRGPGRPRTRPGRVLGDKTSHAVKLSNGLLGCGLCRGERGVFVVGLAGAQAVVQAAEEAVEQVALRGCVAVACGSAPVVVGAGAG